MCRWNYLGTLTQGPRVTYLLEILPRVSRVIGVLPVRDERVQFAIIHAAGRVRGGGRSNSSPPAGSVSNSPLMPK